MRSEVDRFFEKVEPIPIVGCWLWTGATYRKGYGHFRRKLKGKWVMYKAHRFSYEFHTGEIPEDLNVLHTCDITCCVNPHHLWVGTLDDNNKDTVKKGREKFGRNPTHHHLTQELADHYRDQWGIYQWFMTQKEFSKMFGISPQQMSRILTNKIWRNPKFDA